MLTPGFPGLVSGLAPRGSGNVLGAECQLSTVRAAPQAAMVAYVSRSHSRMPVSEPPKLSFARLASSKRVSLWSL
jgi:hypothetical protein